MTHDEVLWFIGVLFGCWVAGYLAGLFITFIKKLSEHI